MTDGHTWLPRTTGCFDCSFLLSLGGVLVRTVDRNCPSRAESKISINNSASGAPAMEPIAKISYISSG